MHSQRIADPPVYRLSRVLTTADVARTLDMSAEGVRYLVRQAQLPCTRARNGIRLFYKADVLRLAEHRTELRLEGKLPEKRWGTRAEPFQPSMFGARILGGSVRDQDA